MQSQKLCKLTKCPARLTRKIMPKGFCKQLDVKMSLGAVHVLEICYKYKLFEWPGGWSGRPATVSKPSTSKARQDKAKQCKATDRQAIHKQGKTRQSNARQQIGKPSTGKARQGKARQGNR